MFSAETNISSAGKFFSILVKTIRKTWFGVKRISRRKTAMHKKSMDIFLRKTSNHHVASRGLFERQNSREPGTEERVVTVTTLDTLLSSS